MPVPSCPSFFFGARPSHFGEKVHCEDLSAALRNRQPKKPKLSRAYAGTGTPHPCYNVTSETLLKSLTLQQAPALYLRRKEGHIRLKLELSDCPAEIILGHESCIGLRSNRRGTYGSSVRRLCCFVARAEAHLGCGRQT